jgi:hypothetical protein
VANDTFNVTRNFFPAFRLNSLEFVDTTFSIHNNTVLNQIHLPRLSHVDDLRIYDNPLAVNFTANIMKTAGSINITGDFANIELFSLGEVTGHFYVGGNPTMDCSWFDDNFLNKVVKGSYLCSGNHTRPSTPRRPSTPTDVAELDKWLAGGGTGNSDKEEQGSSGDGGPSTGAKAGIGAGVGAGVLVLGGVGVLLFLRGRRGKKEEADAAPDPGASGTPELHDMPAAPRVMRGTAPSPGGNVAVVDKDQSAATVSPVTELSSERELPSERYPIAELSPDGEFRAEPPAGRPERHERISELMA